MKKVRAPLVFRSWVGIPSIIVAFMLLGTIHASAQAPQQFSFQGVARDGTGKIVPNATVLLLFNIHKGSPGGQTKFSESSSAITNSNGVFNVAIGDASMASIDWGSDTYYLQIQIDINATGSYVDLGTTQLLSVPYSLHANEAARWSENVPVIQTGIYNAGPSLPSSAPGVKLIWYPRKGAFRAGSVSGNQWDDTQIGDHSFATGVGTTALGIQSAAFGYNTIAKAYTGFSIGTFNNAADNPSNGPNDRIFQIGNGASEFTRTNALTVLRSGNVGIGNNTLAPEFLLDIGGRARIKHNSGSTSGIYFNNSTNVAEGFVGMINDDEIGFYIGNAWRLVVSKTGIVYAQQFYTTSDERLKTDISPLNASLSKLKFLGGYNYYWKDSSTDKGIQTGLIAQKVEKYFPELVTTKNDGYKAVNYIGLIPHLIEAVKELDQKTSEIAELKKELAEVKQLNKRMTEMEASLKTLLTGNTSAIGKPHTK